MEDSKATKAARESSAQVVEEAKTIPTLVLPKGSTLLIFTPSRVLCALESTVFPTKAAVQRHRVRTHKFKKVSKLAQPTQQEEQDYGPLFEDVSEF